MLKHLKNIIVKKTKGGGGGGGGDVDGSSSSSPISAGHMAVYVGLERERFVIPVRFLRYPVFKSLLEKAAEVYGYKSTGGIVLPCEVQLFKQILRLLEKDEKKYSNIQLHDFFDDDDENHHHHHQPSSSSLPLLS